MIINGLKFGMLLQLAVGPICLLVFDTAASVGFWGGFVTVLAVTLIDSLYITLSGLGVAAIINKRGIKTALKFFGAAVLAVFGINMLLSALDISILPSLSLRPEGNGLFLRGLLLTASNPLTIIFWSGIFSSQVAENGYSRRQLLFFGIGCALSTLLFLTAVAALGTFLNGFLPKLAMNILNAAVGVLMFFFAIRLVIKRDKAK